MDKIPAAYLYPLILVAGALQAWGPPMNNALRKSLVNPWLSSLISFVPIVAFLLVLVLCVPRPLPPVQAVSAIPWWAPLGGLIGAFAVVAGLMFVSKVGAGAFAGLMITANFLMSLAVDKYGGFGMGVHEMSSGRLGGAAMMGAGIILICRF